jgi:hypothetical protein
VHIWHLQKRCLPSIVVVNVIPPIAASTIIHIVNAEAVSSIASRFASISIYSTSYWLGIQIFHSFGPFQRLLIFCAKASMVSLPHKFLRPSVLIPVESIFIRLIGCVKPLVYPYLQFIIYFIYDITFSFTGSPFVMGFKKSSIILIGLLSVAVLALPAFS